MVQLIQAVSQPWHWAVSGFLIAVVMFLMLYSGRRFGISSSFETFCAIGGAGKHISLFNFNWRIGQSQLVFILGSIIGGFIAVTWLHNPEPMALSESTRLYLTSLSLGQPDPNQGGGLVPVEIFNWQSLASWQGIVLLVGGGILIGFGTRYAKGCTSGHAISGLSNLQLPSLIAVVGFFMGGLIMTNFLLTPLIQSMLIP
ncbi:MAG: YeeE/YedE family protein [Saprospiraceae bacterium]|nr:YeeE/YedE family protein [Saprospiraceae bacterium]